LQKGSLNLLDWQILLASFRKFATVFLPWSHIRNNKYPTKRDITSRLPAGWPGMGTGSVNWVGLS